SFPTRPSPALSEAAGPPIPPAAVSFSSMRCTSRQPRNGQTFTASSLLVEGSTRGRPIPARRPPSRRNDCFGEELCQERGDVEDDSAQESDDLTITVRLFDEMGSAHV